MNQSHFLQQSRPGPHQSSLPMYSPLVLFPPNPSSLFTPFPNKSHDETNLITQLTNGQDGKREDQDFGSGGRRVEITITDSKCRLDRKVDPAGVGPMFES